MTDLIRDILSLIECDYADPGYLLASTEAKIERLIREWIKNNKEIEATLDASSVNG